MECDSGKWSWGHGFECRTYTRSAQKIQPSSHLLIRRERRTVAATKLAAKDLCRLFHRNHGLPCRVLRTSRFFPEPDDDKARRSAFEGTNLEVCEPLYRRGDVLVGETVFSGLLVF